MKRIYLDYAASTPVDKRVFEVMRPYFGSPAGAGYGNPGSLHSFGQEAIAAVDLARETVGKAIDAEFNEIVFTGSATEANNLALRGVPKSKIIVSAIEHESVLETARDLEKDGVEMVYLPVDRKGFVDLEKLKNALDERTALVSVMYANNEIGTIQPITEISKIIKDFNHEILFHTDAVQAFQYLDCNVNKLGVDLMTLSAHKIYGPKGIGALYTRRANEANKLMKLKAIVTGGGQEFGFRSGTENVPNIVGFAKAVEIVSRTRGKEKKRISELRDYFWNGLKKIYPKAEINGITNSNESELKNSGGILKYTTKENKKNLLNKNSLLNLLNILNVYFPDYKAEDLIIKFDMAGIAVSSGSACRARSPEPSHVLRALGFPEKRVKSSIRFSLGRFTTREEIDETLNRTARFIPHPSKTTS